VKFKLICIGKLTEVWQREAAQEYAARVQRYFPLDIVELKEEKGGRKGDTAGILNREGVRILEKVPERAFLIVLDERGLNPGSESFADLLSSEMLHGGRDWCLLVGGPYGLDPEVRKRADLVLSLSKMTFTHQMARVLLLEQLYRSCTIIKNEPYHNR